MSDEEKKDENKPKVDYDKEEAKAKEEYEKNEKIRVDKLKILVSQKFKSKAEFDKKFDWKSKKIIQTNASQCICKIFDEHNKEWAIKIFSKIDDITEEIVNQIQKLTSVYYHSNIINYENVFCWDMEDGDEITTLIVIQMEWCENTLQKKMEEGVMNEMQALWFLKAGLDVIDYLKNTGDNLSLFNIKPQNIFINDYDEFKFADFGNSQSNQSGMSTALHKVKGSASIYLSPEWLNAIKDSKQDEVKVNGEKIDIYSLGVICIQMLKGQLKNIKEDHIPSTKDCKDEIRGVKAPIFAKILQDMVNPDVTTRIKASELKDNLAMRNVNLKVQK